MMNRSIKSCGLILLSFAVWAIIPEVAKASATEGTIIPEYKIAWGENVGWMNFYAWEGDVTITDAALTGTVWTEAAGWMDLAPSSGGVTNDGEGNLGGTAWIEGRGYVDFSGVTIDESGRFHGIAGDAGGDAGRLSFDCAHCDVRTDWRPISVRPANPPPDDSGGESTSGSHPTGRNISGTAAGESNAAAAASADPGILQAVFSGITNVFQRAFGQNGSTGNVPNQLLDIRLFLEDSTLSYGQDLRALVAFSNFGTASTSVDLLFAILKDGMIVATSSGVAIVQTESLYTKVFDHALLFPGSYVIRLHSIYPGGENDFSQSFMVREPGQACDYIWPFSLLIKYFPILTIFGCSFPWMLLIIIALLIIFYKTFCAWYLHRKNPRI